LIAEFFRVGVPIGDGLPCDARFDRGACHGRRYGT
jgi:hypothetical protein